MFLSYSLISMIICDITLGTIDEVKKNCTYTVYAGFMDTKIPYKIKQKLLALHLS